MKKLLLIVSFCLVLCVGTGFGQTSSAIRGVVEGKTADKVVPLPGATVEAVHQPTGTVYNTITQDDGRYFIAGMKPGGPYKVTMSLEGFKKEEVPGVMLKLGEERNLTVQLVMDVINAGEVVVIESNPIINPNRTGASQNVTLDTIESMPSISRSLDDLTRMAPQFDSDRENSGSFSAGGRNNRYNNIQIDGTQYNDVFGLGASGTPGGQTGSTPISMDAIQEFQIMLAPFDVRNGGFTGGGVNVITRSGTNEFHGSGYYYGRNQSLVGKGVYDQKYPPFKDKQYGFRLGGPIVKDRVFFFVNGELARKVNPTDFLVDDSGNPNDWGGTNVTKADMDRFVSIMKTKWGHDPGGYDYQYPRNTKSNKLLFRFDFNINNSNRLSIRYNYNKPDIENLFPSSTSFRMPDYVYFIKNKTQSTVGQLNTTFSPTLFNELTVAYNRIRDRRTPNAYFPEVTVYIRGSYQIKSGAEYSSQANELDQDAVEITDNLTWVKGNHSFVIGTHNEYFKFRNLFIQNVYGGYNFNSLDLFEQGKPSNYYYGFSNVPGEPLWSPKFGVWQLGFYAGDTWSIKPNFKLTYGFRADVPRFNKTPTANPTVLAYYGIPTNQTPTGNWLLSPRAGFNWDVTNDGKNQIRGGVGKFSGRTPYVWVSNQFSNTGIEFTRYSISGSSVPNFNPDPAHQPVGFTGSTNQINLIDRDFKFPQVLRTNVGYDRQLPWGMVATLEYVWTKNITEVRYQNLNIAPTGARWGDGRPLFGTPSSAGSSSWRYNYKYPVYANVLYLDNTDRGYTTEMSVQLQKQFSKGFSFNGSYTWGKSKDILSGTSSVANSNWSYNIHGGDPNNPPLAYSSFDVKNRIVFSASYTHEFLKRAPTTISAIYTGRSGKPYSSIYGRDFNGDTGTNDLIYVPRTMTDNIVLVSSSGATLTDAQRTDMWNLLDAYIQGDPELQASRGNIMKRNASREPWNHTVDMRFLQSIPMPWLKGHKVEVSMDILNFLNMLNKNWGVYRYVSFDDSTLQYFGADVATGKPKISFTNHDRFIINELLSRWQIQFGVRYVF